MTKHERDQRDAQFEYDQRCAPMLKLLQTFERDVERYADNQRRRSAPSSRTHNLIVTTLKRIASLLLELQTAALQNGDAIDLMEYAQRAAKIADRLREIIGQKNKGCAAHPIYMGHWSGGCVSCNPERMGD